MTFLEAVAAVSQQVLQTHLVGEIVTFVEDEAAQHNVLQMHLVCDIVGTAAAVSPGTEE